MDKEQSAVADFLGEFGNKGVPKDPFNDAPRDPFAQDMVVDTPVDEPKDEKPLPFNKDPKVQKFIEKEISKRMSEYKPEVKETTQAPDTRVDDVLTRLIGNDTPEKVSMIREFKEILSEGTQKAKAEAIAELESRQHAASEADREAEQELETAFENIEENYDVDFSTVLGRKTRTEFASFVEKIAPKDRNGEIIDYPDMNSAWETFSELKKSTSTPSRAKELASRSMGRSAETSSQNTIPVNKHSFQRTDDFIESLSK